MLRLANWAALVLLIASLGACNRAPSAAVTTDDMSMGNPSARVTVVEYASVACPVCARWHAEVFPEFKKTYIDTGQVHFVYREALTGNPALAAAGFLIARCAGPDKYFPVVDAVYRAQDSIYSPGSEAMRPGASRQILAGIAQQGGMSEAAFDRCINDEAALKALNDRVERNMSKDKVQATPTFIIGAKRLEGARSLAELDSVLRPLLR